MGAERQQVPPPRGSDLIDERLREEIELLMRVIDVVADSPHHLTTWQIDALLDVGRSQRMTGRRRRRRRRDA